MVFHNCPCYDFTSQGYVCNIFRHTHIPSYHLLAYPLISSYISPNHQWICSVDHLFTFTIAIMGISTISMAIFKFANCNKLPEGNHHLFTPIVSQIHPMYPLVNVDITMENHHFLMGKSIISTAIFLDKDNWTSTTDRSVNRAHLFEVDHVVGHPQELMDHGLEKKHCWTRTVFNTCGAMISKRFFKRYLVTVVEPYLSEKY